jgi:type IV secretory pathway TraG/TraD family ATPase VirD4
MNWQTLSHGTPSLILAYAVVTASMLAGMVKGRAGWSRYFWLPIAAIPATILCGLVISILQSSWEVVTQVTASGAPAEIAGFVVFMGLGFLGGLAFAQTWPDASHKRGAVIVDASAAERRAARSRFLPAEETLHVGGMPIRLEDETRHFKLIGTTGTGKSTAIRGLLADALARGDRAVIADPDSGYLERFFDAGRGDVILNPFDQRSAKWDLFGEIEQPYDIEQLARSLIPDGESAPASEWRAYARTFFSAVTRQAQALGIRKSGELYRLLTSTPEAELRVLLEGTPAQPFLAEGNARMFGSIRSVTGSTLSAFPYIEQQTSRPFSVRTWVRTGRGVLFIPYRAAQIASLRDLIATWMRLAIFQVMNEPEGDIRLWFIIDELDALGRIDGLKDALARLRKFGGRCVLGFQSIGQVSAIYGQGEAQTIVENCATTVIFRCSASEGGGTARFASALIGEREVVRTNVSTSRGRFSLFSSQTPHETITRSEQHVTESAVMASEIEQLPDGEGFLKFASRPEWLRLRFPMREQPKVAPAFVPLP